MLVTVFLYSDIFWEISKWYFKEFANLLCFKCLQAAFWCVLKNQIVLHNNLTISWRHSDMYWTVLIVLYNNLIITGSTLILKKILHFCNRSICPQCCRSVDCNCIYPLLTGPWYCLFLNMDIAHRAHRSMEIVHTWSLTRQFMSHGCLFHTNCVQTMNHLRIYSQFSVYKYGLRTHSQKTP